MEEQKLIEGLEENDPKALRELYRQYGERIYAVVRSNVKDEWDAEEVTQDVVWKVYNKIDSFRGDSALWTWMYRIAVNEARMKTRKYDRQPVPIEDDDLKAIIHAEETGTADAPADRVALIEVLNEVEKYLEESKQANTTVFLDLELEGRTKEEVAEQLDLSVSAVKARLHRMRVGLRERIRENYLNEIRQAQAL